MTILAALLILIAATKPDPVCMNIPADAASPTVTIWTVSDFSCSDNDPDEDYDSPEIPKQV